MMYKISRDYSWVSLMGTIYLLCESSDRLMKIEKSGLFIWEKLVDGDDIHSIANFISNKYQINVENAIEDIKDFIDQLSKLGVLECNKVIYE